MGRDKHEDIVSDIVTMVAQRSGKIRLQNVPAHCCPKWNEATDGTAKDAAKEPEGEENRVRDPDSPQKTNVYKPFIGDIVIDRR